jgi:hypothetical protein
MAMRRDRKLPKGIFARRRKRGSVYYIAFMVDGEQIQELAGTDLRQAKGRLNNN